MILARAPQPGKQGVLGKRTTERFRGAPTMMPAVMHPEIGGERIEHPGCQHHRLFGTTAAFAVEIEDGVAIPVIEMPALRPREFDAAGAGTDPK